jgi:hypothetical protein
MTILEAALAVLIGVVTRDVTINAYYELRYRLRKRKPNQYQFLLDNLKEEEN